MVYKSNLKKMPKFESFEKRIDQEQKDTVREQHTEKHMENKPPAESPVGNVESKETGKSVHEEIADMVESSADNRKYQQQNELGWASRYGWYSDYAQREADMVSAGAMSELEKSKLDEELEDPSVRFNYRGFRDMVPFAKKSWELASEADGKVRTAKEMAVLVEDGDISREEYMDILKLTAEDPEAAEAKMQRLHKTKCDTLSALAETPLFQDFLKRLDEKERGGYESQFNRSFGLYRRGKYQEAAWELKRLLDQGPGGYPFADSSSCPLDTMFKMQKEGLIGLKEIEKVFGGEQAREEVSDNKGLRKRFTSYKDLQVLRGRGKVDANEFAAYVDKIREEQE